MYSWCYHCGAVGEKFHSSLTWLRSNALRCLSLLTVVLCAYKPQRNVNKEQSMDEMFLVLAPLYSPEREKCGEDLFIRKNNLLMLWCGALTEPQGFWFWGSVGLECWPKTVVSNQFWRMQAPSDPKPEWHSLGSKSSGRECFTQLWLWMLSYLPWVRVAHVAPNSEDGCD